MSCVANKHGICRYHDPFYILNWVHDTNQATRIYEIRSEGYSGMVEQLKFGNDRARIIKSNYSWRSAFCGRMIKFFAESGETDIITADPSRTSLLGGGIYRGFASMLDSSSCPCWVLGHQLSVRALPWPSSPMLELACCCWFDPRVAICQQWHYKNYGFKVKTNNCKRKCKSTSTTTQDWLNSYAQGQEIWWIFKYPVFWNIKESYFLPS